MRFVKRCLVLLPFLLVFLMSHNTFAADFNSWLNIQDISKTNLSNDWITHNTPNAGSYSVSGSTTLQTYRLSASAYLPSQASGAYFTATGDVFIDIPSNLEGGVLCDMINDAQIVPEYVSYNTTNSVLTSCSVSNPNIYIRRYTLHIQTSGSIPSQGTFTSFFWTIGNSSNQSILSLVGTPNDSPRVFLSGNINITISNSPELEGLGIINQNITIISNDLRDMQQQMADNTDAIIDNQNDNTDAIINNQNENTEAIIKSNQNCRMSKNLVDFSTINFTGANGGSGTRSGSTYTVTASSDNTFSGIQFTQLNNLNLKPNTTYTFSAKVQSTENPNGSIVFVIGTFNVGGTNVSGNYARAGERTVVTFTTPSSIPNNSSIRLYPRALNAVAVFTELMLEEGSTASVYEPYSAVEICKNFNEEYYDEQRQADQNISNQSASDINGAENQVTTNLIGIITSFVTELSSFSATDCNLTLPLPSFVGGETTVNICQGKDVLGNFISLFSTLTVVMFYIPLAWILLKMIYNEIRSWTNG